MDSNEDLVSVIIPVYNSEKFLAESIESVLNQTYKNIEIIVIDDGSTDQSLSILKKYSDKITILSQHNQGLASALNMGIKKIKGKWFKWFSPDDILFPNAIEVLLNEAKKLPENSIMYTNWELIDENNKVLRSFSESNYNNLSNFEFNVRLLDGQQINVNTCLIPNDLLKRGCLMRETKDPVAIDYDFFLRAGILYETSFHLIPKPLVKYRIHTNQLSHKKIGKTLSFLSNIREEILLELDDNDREKYHKVLKEYKKKKSVPKKTMEYSLRFAINNLPEWITDSLLTFYLNKIRRAR